MPEACLAWRTMYRVLSVIMQNCCSLAWPHPQRRQIQAARGPPKGTTPAEVQSPLWSSHGLLLILTNVANVRNELTSVDGNIVLHGNRIVIPDAPQKHDIELAHEGHQGLVKTCSLLRSKVWFPKMDTAVDQVVKKCFPCQIATPKPSWEPLKMTPLPDGPWLFWSSRTLCSSSDWWLLKISWSWDCAFDFCEKKLDRVFAAYGVPQVVKSDNGPPFNGHEFAQFADYLGFKDRRVTPLW